MNRLTRRISRRLLRALLRCRYRVSVIDGDFLSQLDGPLLVLPNHPAYIDPLLILSFLPFRSHVRPVVYVDTYRHPALRPWMRMMQALEVPDLRRLGRAGHPRVWAVLQQIATGLCDGDRFLLYPSGRLQRGNIERIDGARATYEVLQRCPDVRIVLVRSRGIWGSIFSCAPSGAVPDLSHALWRSCGWWLLSLAVAMPRRRVTLTCCQVNGAELKGMSRNDLNRWLESWYNADSGEVPQFVPYHRWLGPRTCRFHQVMPDSYAIEFPVLPNERRSMAWRSRAVAAGRWCRDAARRRIARFVLATPRRRRRL